MPIWKTLQTITIIILIKTHHRSKPNNGLTHSIGPKQISESMSGIEIYEDLSISFDKEKGRRIGLFIPGWTSRYMKGDSKDLLQFRRIVSGTYSNPLDEWRIILYAVEINENNQIKRFLLEIGLHKLRQWFESKKPDTWYNGHRHFIIGINESLTEYCIWETQNEYTVKKEINELNTPNTK